MRFFIFTGAYKMSSLSPYLAGCGRSSPISPLVFSPFSPSLSRSVSHEGDVSEEEKPPLLGQGGEACVYRLGPYAVKVLEKGDYDENHPEVRFMNRLDGGKVWDWLQFCQPGFFLSPSVPKEGIPSALFMMRDKESLKSRWQQAGTSLGMKAGDVKQVARGLNFLEQQGVAHRDLKPGNCLVGNDGIVRISDFSKLLDHGTPLPGDVPCTPGYGHAPELFQKEVKADKGADRWALGIMVLEVLLGRYPLGDMEVHTLTFLAARSPKKLMNSLLPEDRPEEIWNEIRKDPSFTESFPEPLSHIGYAALSEQNRISLREGSEFSKTPSESKVCRFLRADALQRNPHLTEIIRGLLQKDPEERWAPDRVSEELKKLLSENPSEC